MHPSLIAVKGALSKGEVVAFLIGLTATGLYQGVKFFLIGLRGWKASEYPLSEKKMLTGLSAKLAASVIMLFGALTFTCGVAAGVFSYFRIPQLF